MRFVKCNVFKKLATELQQSRLERQELETTLVELQHVRDTELQQYRQQLSALDADLQDALVAQQESSVTTETNQELSLELEKEKGRLEGTVHFTFLCHTVLGNTFLCPQIKFGA